MKDSKSYAEIKDLDSLIKHLQEVRDKEGNIGVCYGYYDDYWGSVEGYLVVDSTVKVEDAKPDGPKSGKRCRCVIFG